MKRGQGNRKQVVKKVGQVADVEGADFTPAQTLHRLDNVLGQIQNTLCVREKRAAFVGQAHFLFRSIEQADAEGFGSCSNEGECEAVCPKEIPIANIARMTREYVKAMLATT